MNFRITHDQRFCSFGDNIIYEFVPCDIDQAENVCRCCSFSTRDAFHAYKEKCYIVPCQKAHRHDKNDGFWQISKTVDYQQFVKMLKTGG